MTHLENIQKLFSKNFVENPLLETFEVGKLHLSSGQLVASDPLITPEKQPFTVKYYQAKSARREFEAWQK